jgi:hypothetical protein
MDDRLKFYSRAIDTVMLTVTFSIGRDTLKKDYPFNYEKLEDGLQYRGVFEPNTLSMRLKTYDLSNVYLSNREFYWVNEVPWH